MKDANNTVAKAPDKFTPHSLRGWNTFNRELENYLSSICGLSRMPLIYIICKDSEPNAPLPANPMQIWIVQALLHGPSYQADQQKVYQIIWDAVSGSDGWAWICDVKYKDRHLACSNGESTMMGLARRPIEFKMQRSISSHATIRVRWCFCLKIDHSLKRVFWHSRRRQASNYGVQQDRLSAWWNPVSAAIVSHVYHKYESKIAQNLWIRHKYFITRSSTNCSLCKQKEQIVCSTSWNIQRRNWKWALFCQISQAKSRS